MAFRSPPPGPSRSRHSARSSRGQAAISPVIAVANRPGQYDRDAADRPSTYTKRRDRRRENRFENAYVKRANEIKDAQFGSPSRLQPPSLQ